MIHRTVRSLQLLAVLAASLLPLAAMRAADPLPLKVENVRVAAVPPVATETAAFMVLVNDGDQPVRLVGGSCPVAGETVPMITTRETREGKMVMGMATVPALEVPAHGRLELKPGGDHLMLMELRRVPREGEQVVLTLRFEGVAAGSPSEMTVQAPVVSITAGGTDHAGHHVH